MIIISADIFVEKDKKKYCKPYSFTSLSQFWELSNEVVLFGNQNNNVDISGWVEIPKHITCLDISGITKFSFIKNEVLIEKVKKIASEHSVAYLRMPDKRTYQIYKIISGLIPIFCEFHGDWEEAFDIQRLKTDSFKSILKGLLATYRAKKAKQAYYGICDVSKFNLTIGPRIAEKYGMLNSVSTPCLVTTNHTVLKNDIVELQSIKGNCDSTLKLVYVGELQTRKGVLYLLEALNDLNESGVDFFLKIVGDGYLMKTLCEFVISNELQSRVSFLGAVYDRDKLNDVLVESDVFILPSIAAEGVPRVLQEAQSKGCAIIATDIGSTYWQLEENAGLLIKPKCKNSIAEAILAFVGNPEYLNSMKENAIVRARLFSYEIQKSNIQSFVKLNLDNLNDGK
jgi:glycosyltransferase involved in cell wall biosynthesis